MRGTTDMVTARGVGAAFAGELLKLRAQLAVRAAIGLCAAGPFAFVAALRLQSSRPEDTLFGRSAAESGFATPLVVLGFGGLWLLPLLASLTGGDIFSSEDRYGTWSTLLTRSRCRTEIFAAKVLASVAVGQLAVATLGCSSIIAGMVVIGSDPLVNLSGQPLGPGRAIVSIVLAWLSVLPPVMAFTALALCVSIATRSGIAGIGFPVVAALGLQLASYVDGSDAIRGWLLTWAFGAWHGLLTEPPFYRPLIQAWAASGFYVVAFLAVGYALMRRRDVMR